MDKELKKIKKLYGEAMMHFCRDNFARILETSNLLLSILTSNFYPTHELYKDIEGYNLITEFKGFIFKKSLKEDKIKEAKLSPQKLMAQAGYKLYECLTEEDIQKFRKYYAKDEELCTFWTHRLDKAQVFFAVKKNVKDIKREDYKNPKRQDEYGTSVISIQFTKDDNNTLSIKNRYNHTVEYSDATFSNDLDNIIPGLTKSFEKYYGLKQKYKNNDFEIPSYVLASDGKFYKYNYEIDNIYYCPDNIIIDNYEVQKYLKEKYLILDYFILDLENKKIEYYEKIDINRLSDGFLESIDKIKKVEIRNEGEEKKVLITPVDGEIIEIGLDKLNRIISYKNNNVKEINDYFLYYNECLTNIELNNVEKIGNDFLFGNEILQDIKLPKVEYIAHNFLYYDFALTSLNIPSLKNVGNKFLLNNIIISRLNLPNLEEIGSSFLDYNKKLSKLSLPKLKTVGAEFLGCNEILEEIDAPNLMSVGDCFLLSNKSLNNLYLPNLKIVDDCFLRSNIVLRNLRLPNLNSVGHDFLFNNKKIKTLNLPSLIKVKNAFLYKNTELNDLNLPSLEIVEDGFLANNKGLRSLYLPNLKTVGNSFLCFNDQLEEVKLPSLRKVGRNFLESSQESLRVFKASYLRHIKNYMFLSLFYKNYPNLQKPKNTLILLKSKK